MHGLYVQKNDLLVILHSSYGYFNDSEAVNSKGRTQTQRRKEIHILISYGQRLNCVATHKETLISYPLYL